MRKENKLLMRGDAVPFHELVSQHFKDGWTAVPTTMFVSEKGYVLVVERDTPEQKPEKEAPLASINDGGGTPFGTK